MASAHADVVVQLDIDTRFAPGPDTKNAPADNLAPVNLTLADTYFVVKTDEQTSVYDFEKRKRIVIDNEARTRVDYSLYDTAGFRVLELQNRDMLAKAMAAANIDQPRLTPVDTEHILAIQTTPSAPLQVRTDDAEDVFSNDARVLFRRSVKSTPVSPAEARMFAQFMRYTHGGHPQILGELARTNAIPARLVMVTYDILGTTTQTFTVKSVRSIDAVPPDLSATSLRQAPASTDSLDHALDRAVAITPAALAALRQRSKDELAAAFREGRSLDAFLGILEWPLMTDEALPPLSPEQKTLLQADATIGRLSLAFGAKTKEDLTNAIRVFAEFKATATTKAYVLDIFEANDRAKLGDRNAARKLFLKVLSVNPGIAGVYKDLGDNLIAEFDMPRAWRCWDIGRRFAPKFKNFEPVNQFERLLATKHPEFF
jgi:hypothetical protein